MSEFDERELPHEGTVQDLRLQAARDAYAAGRLHSRLTQEWRENRDQHAPVEIAEQTLTAIAAANYGSALVEVLGWLAAEHPDLVFRAGCIAQNVMIDGGGRWSEDIPWPPEYPTVEPAVSR